LASYGHTTGVVNPVRLLQVVDNTERPTSFTALDRHYRRVGPVTTTSQNVVINHHVKLTKELFSKDTQRLLSFNYKLRPEFRIA